MKKQLCSYRHLASGFVLFAAGALFILTESFAGQISPFQSKQTPQSNQVPQQAQVFAAIDPALLGDRGPSSIRARLQGGGPDEVIPVIIQMAGDPLGRVSVEHGWQQRGAAARSAHVSALASAQAALADVIHSSGGAVTHRYRHVYNGLSARVRRSDLVNLARQAGMAAIYRDRIVRKQLTVSVPFIGAQELNDLGLKGSGIKIGIIDTGIDYTHKDFGGSGTKETYDLEASDPTHLHPGTFPTAKVVGGTDIVGDRYDPGCSSSDKAAGKCTDVPEPDPNPIDLEGHGTGMAGIAAGIGVPGRVGHGIAPEAALYAIKLFALGDTTSSDIVAAIEWAVDPHITLF